MGNATLEHGNFRSREMSNMEVKHVQLTTEEQVGTFSSES